MIEFRFRCWAAKILPTGCANTNIETPLPLVRVTRRKNSRNSGDFWILQFVFRLQPFAAASRSGVKKNSSPLPAHYPIYCRYIHPSKVYPARADCKRNARTPPTTIVLRACDLFDRSTCVLCWSFRPYLHGTSGWSRTNRLHHVTRLQRITRAGAR